MTDVPAENLTGFDALGCIVGTAHLGLAGAGWTVQTDGGVMLTGLVRGAAETVLREAGAVRIVADDGRK